MHAARLHAAPGPPPTLPHAAASLCCPAATWSTASEQRRAAQRRSMVRRLLVGHAPRQHFPGPPRSWLGRLRMAAAAERGTQRPAPAGAGRGARRTPGFAFTSVAVPPQQQGVELPPLPPLWSHQLPARTHTPRCAAMVRGGGLPQQTPGCTPASVACTPLRQPQHCWAYLARFGKLQNGLSCLCTPWFDQSPVLLCNDPRPVRPLQPGTAPSRAQGGCSKPAEAVSWLHG